MTNFIEKACKEVGVKLTEQRKLIAQVIVESDDHPNVEEVYNRAVKLDSAISIATVYRTVNLLEGFGIIEKLEFGDGKARYEVKQGNDHHHHLIDLHSGKVLEFQNEELEKLKTKIAHDLGYRLVEHRLELYGVPLGKNKKS